MPASPLSWKLGVEVELLAPPGRSRRDLADHVAAAAAGTVRRIFYPQAENALVPGVPVFETLTLGFAAQDAAGRPLGRFVDDLTLQTDLAAKAPPKPGWYRIAADDARLARLIARHCDAEAPLDRVLEPARALFGGDLTPHDGGIWRLSDPAGASIALAAPLPGERERPCEVITEPIASDHARALDTLLAPARDLGFLLPDEGAVHLHFDGRPLASAPVLQRLVRVLAEHASSLRRICRTNPKCRRLGPFGQDLLQAIFAPDFAGLPWEAARQRLAAAGATKYCDVNIRNLLSGDPAKFTLEVRILGPTLDTDEILDRARMFEDILRDAVAGADVISPGPDAIS